MTTTTAIALPLAMLAWLALTEWVPMFPLNDLAEVSVRDRLKAGAANYPYQLLIAGSVAWQREWSLALAAVLAGAQLASHLVQWWLPYFGVSTASLRASYRRQFTRTVKLLPSAGHDVVPDVQHLVVGVLASAIFASTLVVAA